MWISKVTLKVFLDISIFKILAAAAAWCLYKPESGFHPDQGPRIPRHAALQSKDDESSAKLRESLCDNGCRITSCATLWQCPTLHFRIPLCDQPIVFWSEEGG